MASVALTVSLVPATAFAGEDVPLEPIERPTHVVDGLVYEDADGGVALVGFDDGADGADDAAAGAEASAPEAGTVVDGAAVADAAPAGRGPELVVPASVGVDGADVPVVAVRFAEGETDTTVESLTLPGSVCDIDAASVASALPMLQSIHVDGENGAYVVSRGVLFKAGPVGSSSAATTGDPHYECVLAPPMIGAVVYLPVGCKVIGPGAFAHVAGLETVVCYGDVESVATEERDEAGNVTREASFTPEQLASVQVVLPEPDGAEAEPESDRVTASVSLTTKTPFEERRDKWVGLGAITVNSGDKSLLQLPQDSLGSVSESNLSPYSWGTAPRYPTTSTGSNMQSRCYFYNEPSARAFSFPESCNHSFYNVNYSNWVYADNPSYITFYYYYVDGTKLYVSYSSYGSYYGNYMYKSCVQLFDCGSSYRWTANGSTIPAGQNIPVNSYINFDMEVYVGLLIQLDVGARCATFDYDSSSFIVSNSDYPFRAPVSATGSCTLSSVDLDPGYGLAGLAVVSGDGSLSEDGRTFAIAAGENLIEVDTFPYSYTCSFSGNGAEGVGPVDSDQHFTDGEFMLPECSFIAPSGCFFDGWYSDESCSDESFVGRAGEQCTYVPAVDGEEVTFYAKWTPKVISVSLRLDGVASSETIFWENGNGYAAGAKDIADASNSTGTTATFTCAGNYKARLAGLRVYDAGAADLFGVDGDAVGPAVFSLTDANGVSKGFGFKRGPNAYEVAFDEGFEVPMNGEATFTYGCDLSEHDIDPANVAADMGASVYTAPLVKVVYVFEPGD